MPDSSNHHCPLCSSANTVLFPVERIPEIRRCLDCDFHFADSFDSEDPTLYDNTFADNNTHPTYEKRDGAYVVRNRDKMISLLKQLEPHRSTGRFLDVGCSAAFFLMVAREQGWTPQGVEIAPWAADFSRNELGIDVFNGRLEDAHFPDNHFDAIFSSHVMEHIRHPQELIKEMVRVLRPGGVHVTVVPTQFAAPSWKLARRFTGDPPPKHASFFDHRTYSALLERCGLKVLRCDYNIELVKLRRLLTPEVEVRARWHEEKARQASGQSTDSSLINRFARQLKPLINYLGTTLGTGDEIIVTAEKIG